MRDKIWLILREDTQGAKLRQLCQDKQINSILIPVIKVVDDLENIRLFITNLNNYDGLVFTSPLSVKVLARYLTKQDLLGKNLFAVGFSTAVAVNKQFGLIAHYPPTSGYANLEKLPEFNNYLRNKKRNLAILGGRTINNGLLEPQLANSVCLYTRYNELNNQQDIVKKIILAGADYGIIISSSSFVTWWFNLLVELDLFERIKNNVMISIHPNITSRAKLLGFVNVLETEQASNASIIKLILGG